MKATAMMSDEALAALGVRSPHFEPWSDRVDAFAISRES
jgi:hypothetical protein